MNEENGKELEEKLIRELQPEWNQPSKAPLEGELEFIHYEKQAIVKVAFYEGHVLKDPTKDYWPDDEQDMSEAFRKELEKLFAKHIDYHWVIEEVFVDHDGGFMREVPK